MMRGQRFLAVNGGPAFSFSDAVSFFDYCGSDRGQLARVTAAMLKMIKHNIKELVDAGGASLSK